MMIYLQQIKFIERCNQKIYIFIFCVFDNILINGEDIFMFCSNCGKEITGKDRFCPYCGCENFQNENSETNAATVEQKEVAQTPVQEKRVDKTIGVLALVFAFVFPLVGLIISICGLAKYKDKENKALCMAGLIITVIDIIIYFVASIFLMGAIVAEVNNHQNYFFLIQ